MQAHSLQKHIFLLTKCSTTMASDFAQVGPKIQVSSPRCFLWYISTKRQRPIGAVAANQIKTHLTFAISSNLTSGTSMLCLRKTRLTIMLKMFKRYLAKWCFIQTNPLAKYASTMSNSYNIAAWEHLYLNLLSCCDVEPIYNEISFIRLWGNKNSWIMSAPQNAWVRYLWLYKKHSNRTMYII